MISEKEFVRNCVRDKKSNLLRGMSKKRKRSLIRHSENKILRNLRCLKTRFRLLAVDNVLTVVLTQIMNLTQVVNIHHLGSPI